MEEIKPIDEMIARATAAVEKEKQNPAVYLERAKLYYKASRFGEALNDVLKVLELDSGNAEARTYETMIRDILEYRYTDYYNP